MKMLNTLKLGKTMAVTFSASSFDFRHFIQKSSSLLSLGRWQKSSFESTESVLMVFLSSHKSIFNRFCDRLFLLSYIGIEKPLDVYVSGSFRRRPVSQQWLRLFLVLTYHSCRQSRLVFLLFNDFLRKKITRWHGRISGDGCRKGILGAGPDWQTWTWRCRVMFFYWMWICQGWGWFVKGIS